MYEENIIKRVLRRFGWDYCTTCGQFARMSRERRTSYQWCGHTVYCPHCSECWRTGLIVTYSFLD